MRSRALRIAVLAWMTWWFVGFLPAHQRGIIRADDAPPTLGMAQIAPQSPCGACITSDDPDAPVERPVQNCGVCMIAAKLDLPQPFYIHLTPFDRVQPGVAHATPPLASREAHAHFLGRAPPRR